ncbi:hypothetical protein [Micromonospora sp. NPDC050200]|uniref:hypothetical protein n=1 Tax=Micromonospora sp. NPDC050200 TaxID=3155664 RepID=UPI0033C641ED
MSESDSRPPYDSERLRDLLAQTADHPAKQREKEWNGIHLMCRVFEANLADLVNLLEWASKEENAIEVIQNVRPTPIKDEFFFHLIRHNHNYVAAVGSLIDHTRKFMRDYEDSEFAREYETRKDQLIREGCANFLKDLRNYMLHKGIPPFTFNLRVENTPLGQISRSRVLLNTAQLLGWPKWSSGSKGFLGQADSGIDLRETVDAYAELVRDLYRWLFEQYEVLHGSDVRSYNQLVTEINLTRGGPVAEPM